MSSKSMSPSVLFVVTNSALNRGMNTGLENLAWGLAERGVEVHILCGGSRPPSHGYQLPENVSYHFTGRSGENPASFVPLFRELVRGFCFDAVIGWIINTALLAEQSCAKEIDFYANLGQMPPRSVMLRFIKATWHKKMSSSEAARLIIAIRRFPKAAEAVVSISEAVRLKSIEAYSLMANKCFVVPRGIDGDIYGFVERSRELREPIEVLFAGNVHEGKGIGDLVQALREMESRISLRVCGRFEPEYVAFLSNLVKGSGHDIHWMGPVSQYELVKYYQSCDIFALPSHAEGLGKALLEAMSCGCPVVCTDIPAFREIVEDGSNGLIVPPQAPKALAAAIQRYIDYPRLRTSCSYNARQQVENKFSKSAELDAWFRLLRRRVALAGEEIHC